MKLNIRTTKIISISLAASIFLTSCASKTLIYSKPQGAKIWIDGESVGKTPYTYADSKVLGSCMSVRMEKEGYESFITNICRNEKVDVGAIIGGIFLIVPFLWTMKYKPEHTYELIPLDNEEVPKVIHKKKETISNSKSDRLRDLKALFDDGILTQKEYLKEKKKILDEN